MPHRKIVSGLKKTRRALSKVQVKSEDTARGVAMAIDKAVFAPTEKVIEQQVLRRIGVGPIGTFEGKEKPRPVPPRQPKYFSQSSSVSKPPKSQTVGFVIPGSLLAEAQQTGSATRRKRARVLARRLGVRSKTLRIRGGPGR